MHKIYMAFGITELEVIIYDANGKSKAIHRGIVSASNTQVKTKNAN